MGGTSTPLGAVAKGLVAGAIGTAAMTGWQEAAARLRGASEGGSDEQGGDPWEQAPVPAQAGRRILSGVFGVDVPVDSIPALTNVMHWGYGTGWGAVYGLIAGPRPLLPRRRARLRDRSLGRLLPPARAHGPLRASVEVPAG
jgi:hypothetical protein